MIKTVTFNDLLKDNDEFNIVYAKLGGTPQKVKIKDAEKVVSFLSENILNMSLLSINNVIIDVDKLIKKYSR